MKKIHRTFLIAIAASLLVLTACSSPPPSTATAKPPVQATATVPQPTQTPDPCAPENIQAEVEKVHSLMREFDDASTLAANSPADQLIGVIGDLQRIRREAEDQKVPACLSQLKIHQVSHMNTVINTMIAFMGGTSQENVNEGIALARQQHDQYTLEMLRVLGVTLIAATPDPNNPTPAAGSTPDPQATSQPAEIYVSNPGPTSVNLRAAPDINSPGIGILEVGQTAVALGVTMDYGWFLIQNPNQPGTTAWVYSSLVQLSSELSKVPIITPTP